MSGEPAGITRRVDACPHCGIRVFFGGDGRCPACGADSAAPPDASAAARIAANMADLARRAAAGDHRARTEANAQIWTGTFCLVVGVVQIGAWLVAVVFARAELPCCGWIPLGLVGYGLAPIGRGRAALAQLDERA